MLEIARKGLLSNHYLVRQDGKVVTRLRRSRWRTRRSFGAALLLAACAAPEAPVANPSPALLLRVHGTADASLTIRIFTQYVSTEKDCRRTTNWLAGASVPQSASVETTVTRSGNDYEASVALDHFLPGECGWLPSVIAFQLSNAAGLSTGRFASTPESSKLVPGPVSKIWVSPAASTGTADPRPGAATIQPLDLKCREFAFRDASMLNCIPDTPREVALISMQATEVRADFQDLTAAPGD